MTYGEIYDEICAKAFAGALPPENMPALIRRKIKSVQRMINRDYNFWFTYAVDHIHTVAGQREYDLPTDFKELEKAYFTINLQNYTGSQLTQLGLNEHIEYGYTQSDSQVEYPNTMRIDGTHLSLYPLPSEIRQLNLAYWKFLPLVDITDVVAFRAYEDDISIYCDDAIIYYVMADIKLDQNEWQASQMYKQEYITAIEGAKYEDNVRRSIPENEAPR